MKAVTVEQMRAVERTAEERYGLSGEMLMAVAGKSAAEIAREWAGGSVTGQRWLMLIGPGNNGGDGRVMAGHLAAWGAAIAIYVWKTGAIEWQGDAAAWRSAAGDHLSGPDGLAALLAQADFTVDALLGIGQDRPLGDDLQAIIRMVADERRRRHSQPRAIALDIPTGLNADTGTAYSGTFAADLTITLSQPKIGLYWNDGPAFTGAVRVGSIGLPPEMPLPGTAELVAPDRIAPLLPPRPLNAHKGTFGTALIMAGSPQYPGAAQMTARAAGRTGAGLITIATTPDLARSYVAALPEAIYALLPNDPAGRAQATNDAAGKATAMLIGPGLGQADETRAWLLAVLAQLRALPAGQRPALIVDADGLNLLSREVNWWTLLPPRTVLTPHPGEMAHLMGNRDPLPGEGNERLARARDLARVWGHIVVLKGAVTIVADPDSALPWLNVAPNPAMATAGMGDVLAGTIVALLAQGATPFAAALAGVALHSRAGVLAVRDLGDVRAGVLATDVADRLPAARASIEYN
jgi:hydroxyethylthiazole kinase-like uncharacterized protein yjeF